MKATFGCGHPRSPENTSSNGNKYGACRTCMNARKRAAYAANLEAARASCRERNLRSRRARGVQEGPHNSRKTHCAQGHEYDDANTFFTRNGARGCRECRRQILRRDHAENRERRLAARRAKYAEDGEYRRAVLAANREWAAANPDKANLNSRLKKHRRRNAGVLTAADWQSVLDRYGSACLACGSTEPPTIDHVIPVSKGGSNTVENVQPLCSDCNTRKATKTIDYRPGVAVV